jgi:DNA-binding beta-propeller fold protein YncE
MSTTTSGATGLRHLGYIDLPEHGGQGGFDHADVHKGNRMLYVAHTANDAVDLIDLDAGRYIRSISGLKGVAGALVSESDDRVFTSNRGEDTVSMFSARSGEGPSKIAVGARPNGLAYDPARGLLLCANVGDPAVPAPPSITFVNVAAWSVVATVPASGRTRWAVHDSERGKFFVNIADPPEILVIDARRPEAVSERIAVPARGPHGLELDFTRRRLYCACDEGVVVSIDADSGTIQGTLELSGPPDVVFLNRNRTRLYVAIGDPGIIDVVDVAHWRKAESVATERGAHTLAFDGSTDRVYVFLPQSHRAAVYHDPI